MKYLIIPIAALAFASCGKCIDTERTWQCAVTSYEIEAIAAPNTVIVPFTGTFAGMKKFEAAHTYGIPGVTDSQECHCK